MTSKTCTRCLETKHLNHYNRDRQTKDGYKVECKECRAYRQWVRTLRDVYDVTPEEYWEMYDKQGGCCDICNKHQDDLKIKLAVDHNHTTGKVRALLCMKCNTDLGVYENKEKEFKEYLNRRDNI